MRLNPKLYRSSFIKSSSIMVMGTIFSQGISLLTAPILTRIYSPENYGVLGIYLMITGILTSFATFQFHHAIISEKEDSDASIALQLTILTCFTVSMFFFLSSLLFKTPINRWLETRDFNKWLLFTPITIFLGGLNTSLMCWANRKAEFKRMTNNRILTSILVPVVSISLGLLIKGEYGLIIGLLVSQLIPTILLMRFYLKTNTFTFQWAAMKSLAHRHKGFPFFSLPSEFINNLINQMPIIFLSKTFGAASAGYYNLSNRMLGLPIQLVSSSVSEVFRQKAASLYYNKGNARAFFNKTLVTLSLLSILPFVILAFFGPNIFTVVFGNSWKHAGYFSQALVLLFFFRFTVSPLTYMFVIAQKQKLDFYLHLVLLAGIYMVFKLSTIFGMNAFNTLLLYSVFYSLIYIVFLVTSFKLAKGINNK